MGLSDFDEYLDFIKYCFRESFKRGGEYLVTRWYDAFNNFYIELSDEKVIVSITNDRETISVRILPESYKDLQKSQIIGGCLRQFISYFENGDPRILGHYDSLKPDLSQSLKVSTIITLIEKGKYYECYSSRIKTLVSISSISPELRTKFIEHHSLKSC